MSIQLLIKNLTGRKYPIVVDPLLTMAEVKATIQEKEGIDIAQMRLIYNGKQLDDNKTTQQCGLSNGSTLHLILQLRGGGGTTITLNRSKDCH